MEETQLQKLIPDKLSQNVTTKPVPFKLQRLAELTVEYRPGASWSDIAKKAGYSPRHFVRIRKTKRFLDLCRRIDGNVSVLDLIDAKGARRSLVKRKYWPAVKDVIDREEGPITQKVEVGGGVVIPIIHCNAADLMAPPIRIDLIEQMNKSTMDIECSEEEADPAPVSGPVSGSSCVPIITEQGNE